MSARFYLTARVGLILNIRCKIHKNIGEIGCIYVDVSEVIHTYYVCEIWRFRLPTSKFLIDNLFAVVELLYI